MDPSVKNLEREANISEYDTDLDDESEDGMNMTFHMTSKETRTNPCTFSVINQL